MSNEFEWEVRMAASVKQLKLRRLAHSIPRTRVARRMNCSYSYVRQLEAGSVKGAALKKWTPIYRDVVNQLIEEKVG